MKKYYQQILVNIHLSKSVGLDIEGDDGWSTLKVLKEEKLPIAVSKGYLLSQKNGVTRLFRDYIETKGKPTFDDIGSTVIIPTSVIVSIKKINLS